MTFWELLHRLVYIRPTQDHLILQIIFSVGDALGEDIEGVGSQLFHRAAVHHGNDEKAGLRQHNQQHGNQDLYQDGTAALSFTPAAHPLTSVPPFPAGLFRRGPQRLIE